jgi:hypothetical protein
MVSLGMPSPGLALGEPIHGSGVSARAVAGPAGGHLVLSPCRSALELGHEMVRG